MKRLTLGILLLGILIACSKKAATTDESSDDGSGTTAFTNADIARATTWTSDCTPRADSITAATYYQAELTLNTNNSFSYTEYSYVGNHCGSAPYYLAVASVYGVYAVSSTVTNGAQVIAFTVTIGTYSPDLMIIDNSGSGTTPNLSTTETAFNTSCGGTSPFCTLSGGTCSLNSVASGAHSSGKSMLCDATHVFPNTGKETVYNVATFSGGVLTLGASFFGIPGAIIDGSQPQSIPTSATVAYH